MPRDGSGQYHMPPGTPGVPNTTIASAKYNSFVSDVELDLNTPRPIVAGGTGATSAASALTALGGEQAAQVVTNFASQVWAPGSFYSATTATGAPVAGHAFAGIAYEGDSSDFVVEARDLTDPNHPVYYQVQSGGVWGSWTQDASALYVKKTGDTMTGALALSYASPYVVMNKSASGQQNVILAQTNNSARWGVVLGDVSAESGSNIGSDFAVIRYNDSAVSVDTPFSISRATGTCTFSQNPINNGGTYIGNAGGGNVALATTGAATLWLRPNGFSTGAGQVQLTSDGKLLVSGNLQVGTGAFAGGSPGDISVSRNSSPTAGYIYYGNSGAGIYSGYNGANYVFAGADVNVNGNLTVGASITFNTNLVSSSANAFLANNGGAGAIYLRPAGLGSSAGQVQVTTSGVVNINGSVVAQSNIGTANGVSAGFSSKTGDSNTVGSNHFNFYWNGSGLLGYVDATYLGTITFASDPRIKQGIKDLAAGALDKIKQIRTVSYRWKDIGIWKDDGKEHLGFLADNLRQVSAACVTGEPGAMTVHKDPETHENVDVPQPMAVDPLPLVALLTKALQEATARIEALEAKLA